MTILKNVKLYFDKNNIDIVWGFICIGLFMSAFIDYAWLISIIACFFIKDDE